MQAMNYDCCRYFAGPDHTLDDFERVMTKLVLADDSQYSYLNTIVAIDTDGGVCGCCVSYDGGKLHELRRAFVEAAKAEFGRDFSGKSHRGRGIATALLNAAIDKAKAIGLPAVGLLVDKGNPKAEKLYTRIGFKYVGDSSWGGHEMKHLQYAVK